MNRRLAPLAIALATGALAAPAAGASDAVTTLEGRALLAADASAPAPFAGVPNAEPAPAPGARQPGEIEVRPDHFRCSRTAGRSS